MMSKVRSWQMSRSLNGKAAQADMTFFKPGRDFIPKNAISHMTSCPLIGQEMNSGHMTCCKLIGR